nr:hypothetical protein [Clostridia bacterium]
MSNIHIDFDKITGKVKPMHAVNNAPTAPTNSMKLYEKIAEANIPYARMHDTGGSFGGSHYVDIENIFPNFDADENDPASYDFAFTDALFAEMMAHGIKPFYRLGCTIENFHKIKAYHIYPPKDSLKWAKICEHIILHYNEGWADGYMYGIEYWEIWNEPDNEPVIENNPMWRGTMEQFFELYDTAAAYLKKRFPHLKIGGYASCGFYAISNANFSETAHSSSRTEYFVEFFLEFLKYISQRKTPLDFFSWHSYAGIAENVRYAEYARDKLTRYGYGDVEVIFNEWNPGIARRGTTADAAYIAGMMLAMQKTSTDMSMYYDGAVRSSYCGLFDPVHPGKVFKAYYTFLAYGKLYKMENEALSESGIPNVYTLAAVNGDEKAVMLANVSDKPAEVTLSVDAGWNVRATDEEHEWSELELENSSFTLPPYAVWLLTMK